MAKVPVFKTVGDSFAFPVKQFFGLLRRIGIVVALLIASGIWLGPLIGEMLLAELWAQQPGSAFGLMGLAGLVLVVFVYSNFVNGTIQVLAGDPMARRVFAFGGRELRFLLLIPFYFMLTLLVFGGALLVSILVGGAFSTTGGTEENREIVASAFVVAMFLSVFIHIWIDVRLSPIFGFIALENRFAVRDAWRASRGNFWRILVIALLMAFGVTILTIPGYALAAVFFPIDVEVLLTVPTSPDDLPGYLETLREFQNWNYFILPFALYGYCALVGMLGHIYLALAPGSADSGIEEETPADIRQEPTLS